MTTSATHRDFVGVPRQNPVQYSDGSEVLLSPEDVSELGLSGSSSNSQSCTVFVDAFGMQVDSHFAQEALHNGSGAICPQCAVTSVRGGGFAFSSLGADNSISWSFSFPTVYAGIELTNAALAETLGLPSNLPQGTPKKYWDPFEQSFNTALKDLGKKKCGAYFGGQGPATMKATTYRFINLPDPNSGAATLEGGGTAVINPSGAYMTYSPTPGQAGPFGALLVAISVPRIHSLACFSPRSCS
jgi:hypothetical protein